jgi:hypothetical protein
VEKEEAVVPALVFLEPVPITFFVPILPVLPEPAFEIRNSETLDPTENTPADVLDLLVPRSGLPRMCLVCGAFPEAIPDELEASVEKSSKKGRGDLDREDRVDASEPRV